VSLAVPNRSLVRSIGRIVGNKRTQQFAVAVALFALVAFATIRRFRFLSETPFPVGIDGYFYPQQLRSILHNGTLDSSTSPLAFYLMAPLAWLTDPIVGAKLGASLLCACAAFPAYCVAVHLSGLRTAGLLAATIVALSHGGFYLSIEFVKQGVGITVALTLLWLLLRATDRPSKMRIALCVAGVIAAFFTHKMAAPLALLLAAPAIIITVRNQWSSSTNHVAIAVAVSVSMLVIAVVAIRHSATELSSLFATTDDWMLPALRLPRNSLFMGYEPLAAAVVALLGLLELAIRTRLSKHNETDLPKASVVPSLQLRITTVTTLAFITFALLVAIPWLDVSNPQGLAFRLRIIAFVPLAILSSIVVVSLLRRLSPHVITAAILTAITTYVLISPNQIDRGVVRAHPAMVAAVQGLIDETPSDAFIIVPERHIAFMTAWYTGRHVRLRPEGTPLAHRYRLLTLSFIVAGSALEHAIDLARSQPNLTPPLGVHPLHQNGLVLIEEPTWNWILQQLPPQLRARPLAWPTI
jgi:hypothetical protein